MRRPSPTVQPSPRASSTASALGAIEAFLHDEARAGRRCLLVVDESQNLAIDALKRESLPVIKRHLRRAFALDDKAGVKKDIERLERDIKNAPAAQDPTAPVGKADEAGGDTDKSAPTA